MAGRKLDFFVKKYAFSVPSDFIPPSTKFWTWRGEISAIIYEIKNILWLSG
jgi:hypothetical protein